MTKVEVLLLYKPLFATACQDLHAPIKEIPILILSQRQNLSYLHMKRLEDWINCLLTNDSAQIEADLSACIYLDNYLLFDSVASVYMFHSKDGFSNLRRDGRKESLFCSQNIVKIER